MNINVFLLFLSFVFFELRERGYTKFGIRRNSPKGTYLISLMEFRGESFFFYGLIDFMLFLTLAWRTWVPRVRDVFFVFYPEYWRCFVCLLRTLSNDWLFLLSISADGKESPLPFWGPSQWFGFSLLPLGQAIFLGLLDVTQVPFVFHQVTQYKHLFFHSDPGLLLWDWPTFFHVLTAILWRLATVNSNGRIVLILFLSSQWDITWQRAPPKS